ncbi:MAG: phosphoribosylformylglycinamidine synthase II [Deltaproteobacteria bacterium]|nr:phosphoribosylformylglycinamidine synthase II [Deltaproteobacteria bacterium]
MTDRLRVPPVSPRPGDPQVDDAAVREHGLTTDEFARVCDSLGRAPTWTELGVFSVMWSEHCSYKTSRKFLKQFPTEGPRVLQGPGENAGVVDVGDGLGICFKMESHNHPSFIEPYQGAATGVGGILRDVFTMNARPIALLNSLRFGSPDHPKTRHLVDGVVAGIAGYGNCIGVPTVAGEVAFHPCYDGNNLVNAMAVGTVSADRIFRGIAAGVGNPVLYVGARTGRDGIHGATMASDSFEEGREGPRPTVQVGDPYTEKLLLEACMELLQKDAVVAIQDMGAAGLTSSSVEMAGRGGTGLLLHVDRVPRRESGMTPYECLLSESQERMLIVAARGREDVVEEVFSKWDLEAVVVGEVTDDGLWTVVENDRTVASIPVGALTDDAPVYDRPRQEPADLAQRHETPDLPAHGDCNEVLLRLLASPNIADKRWVYRQYDHMVRVGTLVKPGAADAAVIGLPGTSKAIAVCVDGNSVHVKMDPFEGAQGVIAEACRNVACTGAEPLGATDCLNFGNPERPEVMWEFERAVAGLAEGLRQVEVPIVSGNVSFYNETGSQSIHPTPTVGIVGLIEDRAHAVGLGLPESGQLVLLGSPRPVLGATAYARCIHDVEQGMPPRVQWDDERALLRTLRAGVARGLIRAAHDVSEGGLAVALAEMALAGGRTREVGSGLGCSVQLPAYPEAEARELLLFGETHGCAWVVVDEEDASDLLALSQELGCPARVAGSVGGDELCVADAHGTPVVQLPIERVRDAWEHGFSKAVGVPAPPPRP